MPLLSTWLTVALSLSAAAPPAANEPTGPTMSIARTPAAQGAPGPIVTYEIRLAHMPTTEWRGRFGVRLTPLGRSGGAAVWATDDATVRDLFAACQEQTRFNLIMAPRMVAPVGDGVSLINAQSIAYVAHLGREADGPPGQATRLAFKPEVEHVRDGLRLDLSAGRLTDSGLLTHLAVDFQKVLGIETSSYTEGMKAAAGNEPRGLSRLVRGDGKQSITATLQVPLVHSARIEGEWVIPKTGYLVVGMGPQIVNTGRSHGETVEEVVILRYQVSPGETPTPAPAPSTATTPRRLAPTAN